MNHVELIRKFWTHVDAQEWEKAQELLHPGFIATWPQSRERMRGPGNFIAVNRHYPGDHRIEIIHIHELGGKVMTTVWITADTGQKTFAISYFDVKDGRIARAEEYWAEPYEAPSWRTQWVERY